MEIFAVDALKLNQAAKAVGISRRTLDEMVATGVLSAQWDRLGNRVIEVSEMFRVFGKFGKHIESEEKS
ncbi:MAG: hypothetical protein HQL95_02795 [Magnetococcales bacterium]|nr:hypothetical protein [Magnetococcales bacterium]